MLIATLIVGMIAVCGGIALIVMNSRSEDNE